MKTLNADDWVVSNKDRSMTGWLIYRGDKKEFPCIVYESKERYEEIIEGLVKVSQKLYSGLTAKEA